MNYIERFITNFRDFYNEINSATLTGAIDVIVVEQPDGSYLCSPFHVRFGKLGVLRSKEKIVDIEINNEPVDIHMKLGDSGEAFFVEEIDDDNDEIFPSYLATSPLPNEIDENYIANELEKLKLSINDENSVNENANDVDDNVNIISEINAINEEKLVDNENIIVNKTMNDMINNNNNISDNNYASKADVNYDLGNINNHSASNVINDESTNANVNDLNQIINENHNNNNNNKLIIHKEQHQHQQNLFLDSKTFKSIGIQTETICEQVDNFLTHSGHKRKRRRKASKRSFHAINHEEIFFQQQQQQQAHQITKNEPEDIFVFEKDDEDSDDEEEDDDNDVKNKCDNYLSSSLTRSASVPIPTLLNQSKQNLANYQISESLNKDLALTIDTTIENNNEHQYPFSDGELSPFHHHHYNELEHNEISFYHHHHYRSNSPKSDTEYEMSKHDATSQTESNEVSWQWGELPQMSRKTSINHTNNSSISGNSNNISLANSNDNLKEKRKSVDETKRSMLSNVFGFIGQRRRKSNNNIDDGILLDDINLIDPELRKQYFPELHSQLPLKKFDHDDSNESGNGPSLSQSPHSQSDERTFENDLCFMKIFREMSISLCGGLNENEIISKQKFNQSLVSFDEFCVNINTILKNPNLVFQVNEKYYNWQTISPIILSMLLYQRQLPDKIIENIIDVNMPKKKKETQPRSSWWYWSRRSTTTAATTITNASTTNDNTDTVNLSTTSSSTHTPTETFNEITSVANGPKENHYNSDGQQQKQITLEENKLTEIKLVEEAKSKNDNNDDVDNNVNMIKAFENENELLKNNLDKSKTVINHDELFESNNDEFIVQINEGEENLFNLENTDSNNININNLNVKKKTNYNYRKTLRLSSEQIKYLNLLHGTNEIVFSVTTAYQGTTTCKCHLYLWRYDDKIIISDIDGTITKSDVLGHILPILGKDWAQSGVASLFTKFRDNGYKLLYLSARAIGQARITREYLKSVRQDDICLPDGPLLLSPTSLISAFHREVIEKKPEEFKISCLKDIQALFPTNPFYAGFGNKINDTWAYRAVGIPLSKIFTINHRGELKLELIQFYQSSYTRLIDYVDQMFPPISQCSSSTVTTKVDTEYESFAYWKEPLFNLANDDPLLRIDEQKISLPVKANTSK